MPNRLVTRSHRITARRMIGLYRDDSEESPGVRDVHGQGKDVNG